MTKKLPPSPLVEKSRHEPTSSLLLHSSEESAWDGLVVRVYREPREIEQLAMPLVSTPTLGLLMSGTMYEEQRELNGPWKGQYLRQGDLFLRPAGRAPYEIRWQAISSQPVQILFLQLPKDLVSHTIQELAGTATRQVTLAENIGFQDPLLMQICLSLWHDLKRQAPAETLYLQSIAQLIAVHLLRRGSPTVENDQTLTRQQMRHVTDFIQAHLDQALSLEQLAQQTGLSPYYFSRMFRQTTGESPHQFVLGRRIELAQQLLTETDASLAQVALQSGFASQSHLSSVFKRRLGLTPRAYRNTAEI
jgi:AraC family transcriptional regulator